MITFKSMGHDRTAPVLPEPLTLSDQVQTLLAIVAAHDRISPAEFLARAVSARADAIGIAKLTGWATSHNRESEKGPEGVPRKGVLRAPPVPP